MTTANQERRCGARRGKEDRRGLVAEKWIQKASVQTVARNRDPPVSARRRGHKPRRFVCSPSTRKGLATRLIPSRSLPRRQRPGAEAPGEVASAGTPPKVSG